MKTSGFQPLLLTLAILGSSAGYLVGAVTNQLFDRLETEELAAIHWVVAPDGSLTEYKSMGVVAHYSDAISDCIPMTELMPQQNEEPRPLVQRQVPC